MIGSSASLYAAICVLVVVFQICLIAGAPWGRYTQGGSHAGALPVSGRVAAAVSIVILTLMAAAMLSAANLPPNWPRWTGWAAMGVQTLSTLMNWITPSKVERQLWGPVTALMLILAGVVMWG